MRNCSAASAGWISLAVLGLCALAPQASAQDLTIASTHTGTFLLGQTNAYYVLRVRNVGSAPTAGNVTIAENAPSGLTITSMRGDGWTCVANSCDRTDAMAPGAAYPAIMIVASVEPTAGSSLTNQATVSGGGDTNVANNTASDNANVVANGYPVTWGDNSSGQSTIPAGLTNVVAVSAGGKFSLALRGDGTVVAWGLNSFGQTDVPADLSHVVAIAAGPGHCLALKSDGTVVAWGDNSLGAATLPAGLSGVLAIAAGTSHSLALKSDGTVVAWGYNMLGESIVPGGLADVVGIAAGAYSSLAVKIDGSVVEWGQTFAPLPAGLANVVAVASGQSYSLALESDGAVVAWGSAGSGTTNVPFGLTGVVAVAAGYSSVLALKSDGTVVSWGDNFSGQNNLPAGLLNATAIGAGGAADIAITSSTPTWVQVAVATSNYQSSIKVDGVQYSGPSRLNLMFDWSPASSHTLEAVSPITLSLGSRYVFIDWSDGGAVSHTVAPAAAITYTANYKIQDGLTTLAVTGGTISPASGWVDDGTQVQITASASPGHVFTGFSGGLTGTTNPQNLTISGATTVTANFTPTPPDPFAPALASPLNGASGVSLVPALLWASMPGAQSYDVYFGTSPSPPQASNTAGTSYSPAGPLSAGTTYYWMVVAKNGSSSAGSAIWSFTTQPSSTGLAISSTHTGNFWFGETGANYKLIVSNGASGGPTNGTVDVREIPPEGVVFISMAGPGWLCGTTDCTRDDVLAPGQSYPPIYVIVDVPAGAPTQTVNHANVSGGSYPAAYATDITNIVNGVATGSGMLSCNAASVTAVLRSAGVTEALSPVVLTCNGTNVPVNASYALTLYSNTTGLTSDPGSGNYDSAVTLTVGSGPNAPVVFGEVDSTSTSVTFGGVNLNATGVVIPTMTNQDVTISGLRVNASALVAGPFATGIGMTLVAQSMTSGVSAGLFGGTPIQSLSNLAFAIPALGLSFAAGAGVPVNSGVIQLSQGSNPVPLDVSKPPAANEPLFKANLAELFPSALSLDAGGSRLAFNFSYLPANLGLYVLPRVDMGDGVTASLITAADAYGAGGVAASSATSYYPVHGRVIYQLSGPLPFATQETITFPFYAVYAGTPALTGDAPPVTLQAGFGPLSKSPIAKHGEPVPRFSTSGLSIGPIFQVTPARVHLAIVSAHTGTFVQGQSNAIYTLTVSSVAPGDASSGTVTATDAVPTGLTLVSMAGTGWTCPSGGTTCTRSDALQAGASYPPIAVTVNVQSGATSPQVNSVSVSGGGSATASTTDSTVVGAGASPGPPMSTTPSDGATSIPIPASLSWTVSGSVTSNDVYFGTSNPPPPAGSTAANSFSPAGLNYGTTYYWKIVSNNNNGSGPSPVWSFTTVAANAALRFIPITPCRILDTRKADGPFGGPAITAGTSRDFAIPNSTCGIPATAQAYSLNVTVVPPASLGYLTIWPAGQTKPLASTLNSLDGRIKANAAIVPAGTGGAVSVFSSSMTQVVLDIDGYFVPATDPSALAFYPLTPCRVSDTRHPAGELGGPLLTAGTSRTVPILSSSCGVPASAKAYSLNITAVPNEPLGYLTTWPTGQIKPTVSTLNAPTAAITANAAIVPAGAGGAIDVFASSETNLVVDINGYFAPAGAGGLSLYNLPPCRVMDSRKPEGAALLTAGVHVDVDVTNSGCGAPLAAQAYVINATVVPTPIPGGLGYLTLWPQGQTRAAVSTLNALDGQITSNMAIVPTADGSISAYPSSPTHMLLDISAYFAP